MLSFYQTFSTTSSPFLLAEKEKERRFSRLRANTKKIQSAARRRLRRALLCSCASCVSSLFHFLHVTFGKQHKSLEL